METLKIHRVNKNLYLIKEGKRVVKECRSYKDAVNTLISDNLILDDGYDSYDEYEDYCLDSFGEAA